MAQSIVINALAKVMIATAWVDGQISYEEMNSLKDLLFQLPEMTASDWAELDIYIETPIGEAERARLVAELEEALRTPEDKLMAISAIDEVIHADGELSASEMEIAEEIKASIQGSKIGIFSRMGKMLASRHTEAINDAPNRELYLDDYEKNKIFYSLSRRLELDQEKINVPENELRKLSLAGGLMARIAYVDREVDEQEFNTMVSAINQNWELNELQASLVAEIAVSEISKNIDYYRLSRGFFESTSESERIRFLDVLFTVAAGDGEISYNEIEEIRTIATVLKLSHKQFIDAKLKVPREERAN